MTNQATIQAQPTQGKQSVFAKLRELLDAREQKGIETYGRSLETFNGRDATRDLVEELLDASLYALQWQLERAELTTKLGEVLTREADLLAEVERIQECYNDVFDDANRATKAGQALQAELDQAQRQINELRTIVEDQRAQIAKLQRNAAPLTTRLASQAKLLNDAHSALNDAVALKNEYAKLRIKAINEAYATLHVRPEIRVFAIAMQVQLDRHPERGDGWKVFDEVALHYRAVEEFREYRAAFAQALNTSDPHSFIQANSPRVSEMFQRAFDQRRNVLHEAADVANMLMMICDVMGLLKYDAPDDPGSAQDGVKTDQVGAQGEQDNGTSLRNGETFTTRIDRQVTE